MSELSKTFDPGAIEARWYPYWEENGLFRPERPEAEPWTIVNPPPNVTGSLHIGHALDNTLQDILTRHARLQGKDALWVVGTDHAGIATQMVVERNLEAEGKRRADMSREEFVAKVWEWKEESGGQITRQLRRLGCSMDWANERFTMDEGFSRAVLKVFVDLYRQGLLYRDKRLVNWDPKFGTAISDLEVETREVQGKFWHLKYPLENGSGFIHVATTRPETMLADMAVAVHPEDERYTALIGKKLKHPITGRLIPIVADEHADPELGSGAVKITPGHDFNDFEVGKRAGFKPVDMLNMFDAQARVVQTADGLIPEELLGLDRFDARDKVVARLEAEGFLEKVEDRVVQTPFGDRSGAVIEPWLTDQWYVDAATLAKPAIAAVRDDDIRVVPETWKKTWFNWLENIQPWCVSRQLWWGHQIPAWYDHEGNVFVAESEEEARAEAGNRPLRRDPDVLDTWFSSALWPFATLGWPEETELLKRHYPNDILISGFDIIFFWDARMAMQGFQFMKEKPWNTLYLHGLVRDAKGQKMSKSKGNTVDPLGLVDKYGADALRFTLAAMESQGRDIKLDEKRVEGYRNFATKLWNAARFCQSNGIGTSKAIEPPRATLPVNRWIVGETVKTVQALDLAMAELRFDESANTIYHFTWATFCDWYLELIKPVSSGDERGQIDEETREVAAWVLDQILVMLHPFMPFITEELWHAMGDRPYPLILAKWPMPDARALNAEAGPEIDWLIRLVSGIRATRSELNVPPSAKLALHVRDANAATIERLGRHDAAIKRLARIETISGDAAPAGGAAQVIVDEATFVLPLEGVIDLDAERSRLSKALQAAEKERDSLSGRLSNPSFVERAKPEAVEKARADHAEKASDAERYAAALARLG
ncbi:valine--tRNA ligase [Sphingosinicella humi]|uniref:Valine--tRNA ligase n=1 Tax=Allosphingosinicella humi TaxID=2068657 RepID=A0A2U2J5G6_9SPHN|nr:valine--tRNA ligase [Sphingosinicella humi]PWG03542.1 valine--tRNA ligase [Sphingosinicella humi]